MIRFWITLAVVVILVAGAVTIKIILSPPPVPENATQETAPRLPGIPTKTLMNTALLDAIKSGKPTLADFGRGTCQQCIKQAPILDQAVEKYQGKVNIVFVNTAEFEALARQYKVAYIPTQIVFDKDGKEVTRHVGVHPLEAIAADLAKAGVR